MSGTETACRQGDISTELVRLSEKKEQLHDRIGILFDRLQNILKIVGPNRELSGQSPERQIQSQLAIDLSSVSATLETDMDKINEIIDRLEL